MRWFSLWLLVVLILVRSSGAQEVKQAPTVEQCQADQRSPGCTHVAANTTANMGLGSARIQNIATEEMWSRVTRCVFPKYPVAFNSHIAGTVDIGLVISPEGDVASTSRVLDGPALLVPSAMDAIRLWKLQPNIVQGEKTWSRVRALARFNVDGTTAVDLTPAILADNFGDPGTPKSAAPAFPRPVNAPECIYPPRAVFAPDPDYSERARRAHIQGTVELALIVGIDGRPHDIKIVTHLDKDLDKKAMEAAQQWRFTPALKEGKQPVETHISITVSFRLH